MGWESFRSEWDEPVDDDMQSGDKSDSAKKKKKPKQLSWWDQFQEESETGLTDSETDKFSYRDAFDDSDTAWYRRSSFRYGGYRDYSPSSLFRSSFSGWRGSSLFSSDNEAKNKAIRALRSLTRSANTIANALKKIKYEVQFSSGTDSNGSAAEIGAGKAQTIFVSPDTVVDSKDQNEEDAAIDALTGFVLLRVQLSQSIDAEVIRDINACGLRAMPVKLAGIIRSAPGAIEAASVAAELADNYSASVLAKSMLTRLCRRAVISDWSGFAPYFVRHAKKFATTREKLEAGEFSTEILAAKIAYNMIAAEDELPIDPEVTAIAAKHLGEELEQAAILPACKKLVAELREYVANKTPAGAEVPAGELEKNLSDGLQQIIDESGAKLSSTADEEKALYDGMEDLASLFDALHMQDVKARQDNMSGGGSMSAASAVEDSRRRVTELKYKEKLLAELKKSAKQLATRSELAGLSDTDLYYRQQFVEQSLAHFNKQYEELLNAAKVAGIDVKRLDFAKYDGMGPHVKAKTMAEDIAELAKQLKMPIKAELENIKNRAVTAAKDAIKNLPAVKELFDKLQKMAEACRQKLLETSERFESADTPAQIAAQLADQLKFRRESFEALERTLTGASGSKDYGTLAKVQALCDTLRSAFARGLSECHTILNHYGWHPDPSIAKFLHAANNVANEWHGAVAEGKNPEDFDADEMSEWHDEAIADFIERNVSTAEQFETSAMQAAHQNIFTTLRELLSDKDHGSIPKTVAKVPSDKQNALQNAAESMGLSPQELLNMLHRAEEMSNCGKTNISGQKLGRAMSPEKLQETASAFSPVDNELFGEAVEKKTTILDGKSIGHVNDEARNAPEEDYVAYLSHNEAKPTIRVEKKKQKADGHARQLVTDLKSRHRGAIERIRNALQFQSTKRTGEVYGMRSGDLDEGSLHKLGYDSEHIWTQKTITKLPDVAVGILVDQSGSMASGNKIVQAREMCILLAEALKRIEGVHLHIYGHTANRGTESDLTLFEHYSSVNSSANADLSSLGSIAALSNNYDGYAIKETAKRLSEDPAKRKYLFVISDGLPHGTGYSGEQARKHVTSVCSFVRTRLKIATYAFAVGVHDPENRREFELQYGNDKVVFLSNVMACLPQIVRFLRNALQKEKNLVNVGAD